MNRGGGDRAPSRGPGRALLVLVLLASMPAVGAGVARAQASCLTRSAGSAAAAGPTDRVWTEPLDRTISIRIRDLPLRDALERVSAAARIRISYASDLLPLDREVCLGYESQRVGDVLAALLRGTAVEPVVVAGSGQVVLAPVRAARTGEGAPQLQRSVGVLDRVVVTGSAAGEAQRPLPVALDVVSGHALADRDAGSISSTLDGAVPGVWV